MNLFNVSKIPIAIEDLVHNVCDTDVKFNKCGDSNLKKSLIKIGIIVICILGITANILCIYLFRRLKSSFKNSSYIFYLKFLSLSDTLCLIMELLKPLNLLLAEHTSEDSFWLPHRLLLNINDVNCKLVEFLTPSFHLTSAWLICAFSIERCIAVYWPLLIRQLFNISRTKYICWVIFTIAPSIQLIRLFVTRSSCSTQSSRGDAADESNIPDHVYDFLQINRTESKCLVRECKCDYSNDSYGRFLGAYNAYFHQLTCLVIIPTLVVVTCNSMVFYRIIQRRRMINSGKLFVTFKINKNNPKQFDQAANSQSVPMIKVTLCGSGDPELTISKPRTGRSQSTGRLSLSRHAESLRLNESRKASKNLPAIPTRDGDSFNSGLMTIDDEMGSYSTTFDETTRSYDYPKSLHNSSSMSSNLGASAAAKHKRNKLNKRNRDIKLALLMIFSGAFLVFVLPQTLLNIYQYRYMSSTDEELIWNMVNASSSQDYTRRESSDMRRVVCQRFNLHRHLSLYRDVFHMLKLLYFSSNFLAYLTLTTFSRVKRVKKNPN